MQGEGGKRERGRSQGGFCKKRVRELTRTETGGTKLTGQRKSIKGWGRKREGGRE